MGWIQRGGVAAGLVLAGATLVMPAQWASAANPPPNVTVVVSGSSLATSKTDPGISSKWFFYNDNNDTIDNTLGTFVSGPATPPLGTGSAQIAVSGTGRSNIATYRFAGTVLSTLTTLDFSLYTPSAANNTGNANTTGFLNFNVDFDGSDTWQRRLVFDPYYNSGLAGEPTTAENTWQTWDAINGGNAMWTYSGADWPGTSTPGDTARKWSDILASYPGVRIRVSDPWLGIRVGDPNSGGLTENIDAFQIGTASRTTTFDFEPTAPTSSGSTTVSGDVNGDGLTVGIPSAVTMNPVVLDGTNLTSFGVMNPFDVVDSRGTGAGWNVTFSATPFSGGGHTLPAGSFAVNALAAACEAAVTCTGTATGTTQATPVDTGTPVKVARAQVGAGMGTYKLGPASLTLAVPAGAYAGTYTSTVTITVTTGP